MASLKAESGCPSLAFAGAVQSALGSRVPQPGSHRRPPKAPLPGYERVGAEEFSCDTLDKSKGAYRTDSRHLSTQKLENVLVRDGVPHLQLKQENQAGKDYTGAGSSAAKGSNTVISRRA